MKLAQSADLRQSFRALLIQINKLNFVLRFNITSTSSEANLVDLEQLADFISIFKVTGLTCSTS